MYYITKTIEIAGSHHLDLPYPSKCARPHGHNWTITVHCRASQLNPEGMVLDFSRLKEQIRTTLDHQDLNQVLPFNPTAENLARWICDQVPHCFKVEVLESPGNLATYIKD